MQCSMAVKIFMPTESLQNMENQVGFSIAAVEPPLMNRI